MQRPAATSAPFSDWSVRVEPHPDEARVARVTFDSPSLGRETTLLVWVPAPYDDRAEPFPVVYFLHGTVAAQVHAAQDRVLDALERAGLEPPPLVRTGRSAVVHPDTMGFHELLDDGRFLIVAPDAGAPPFCQACNWIDGLRGEGVSAETHLYDEVIPLVEHLWRVRTDRSGRAITGHSMGGGGAAIQGFRHPDRFGFVGCSSGVLSLIDDFVSRRRIRWVLYNRSQGFRPLPKDEIHYRNHNLLDLAPGVVGSGLEVMIVIGDGTPDGTEFLPGEFSEQTGYEIGDRGDIRMETTQRRVNDEIAGRLTELGVPFTYVTRGGLHSIGRSTFHDHFLPRLERVFADGVEDPIVFQYKSADRRFSIWGYEVAAERPNTEFLHLLRARRDGRDFTLAGTGHVEVRTPPTLEPGRTYALARSRASDPVVREETVADAQGRVTLAVELGRPRAADETRREVARGHFPFPQTRVELSPARAS